MYDNPSELFNIHFLPAYPKGWKDAVKGDMITIGEHKNIPAADLSRINSRDEQEKVIQQIIKMKDIGLDELGTLFNKKMKNLENVINSIDKWYDVSRIDNLIHGETPSDDKISDVFIRTIEIGAILGHRLIELDTSLQWLPDYPYWESPLFHKNTGTQINVFHWALKKFTLYGIEDGLSAKCKACINLLHSKIQ